ncbi:MAG: nucleotidyltransferase domain-containing protein [Clostridia bacterium]|nr:nucleotidyltransferase domain-containing protein [Clostridia bacterium]
MEQIVKVVNRSHPDSEIYLYGSQARGDSKKMSDWDLLILLNSENIPFDLETKLMDDFYEIELDTGEIISPMIYSKSDWIKRRSSTPLYENVQKEGVKIK